MGLRCQQHTIPVRRQISQGARSARTCTYRSSTAELQLIRHGRSGTPWLGFDAVSQAESSVTCVMHANPPSRYAHAPCPVWIPKECSREWAEQWRSEVEDGSKSRRNPIYCFETVDLGFNAGQNRIQYESAKNQDHVAQYHQYSGNELARLDGCLWSEKYGDGQMALNQKCRKRYLPFMKHHNIENKKCKEGASGLLCEQEENYWQHKTTGWPAGCLKSEPACWVHSVKRWLVGESPASTEVGPVLEPSWAAANTTNETSGSAEQDSTMVSEHRG